MPIPLILAGIGAAAAGAYAYSKLKDDDDYDDDEEEFESRCHRRLNKANRKLKRKLLPLEQATQRLNDASRAAANDSKLVVGALPAVSSLDTLTMGSLAIEYADQKFKVLRESKLYDAYDIKESAKAFRKKIAPHAALIDRAATTLEDLLARYRKDRANNQHLVGAIRVLLTYNHTLLLPVALFDPNEDILSTEFKFNPKFLKFTEELAAGLDEINVLLNLKQGASAVTVSHDPYLVSDF